MRAGLVGIAFECADDVAVLDGSRLVGIVPIERLLAADPGARMAQLMDADPPVVAPGAPQERVAWQAVEQGESSVAVVDGNVRFVGLIPPQRIVGVLLAEHDEDLARLGGYLSGSRQARAAAQEPVDAGCGTVCPGLLVGLLGASAFAGVIGAFEHQLEAELLLASFVPGVMADAVGTQTETLVIRGLSAGAAMRAIARRELITGLGIGIALALPFLPIALLVWGNARVAVAVALALLASTTFAIATPIAT